MSPGVMEGDEAKIEALFKSVLGTTKDRLLVRHGNSALPAIRKYLDAELLTPSNPSNFVAHALHLLFQIAPKEVWDYEKLVYSDDRARVEGILDSLLRVPCARTTDVLLAIQAMSNPALDEAVLKLLYRHREKIAPSTTNELHPLFRRSLGVQRCKELFWAWHPEAASAEILTEQVFSCSNPQLAKVLDFVERSNIAVPAKLVLPIVENSYPFSISDQEHAQVFSLGLPCLARSGHFRAIEISEEILAEGTPPVAPLALYHSSLECGQLAARRQLRYLSASQALAAFQGVPKFFHDDVCQFQWANGLEALTLHQRHVDTIYDLWVRVNMGGWSPIYDEMDSHRLIEMVDSLKAIGAFRHADLAQRANDVMVGPGNPISEFIDTHAAFDPENTSARLREICDEWSAIESVESYLFQYAAKHPSAFRNLKPKIRLC